MPRRTKDEAEQTRNAILDAAEKVFYANGVAHSSMEDIAHKAGVTRGAIYWHFKDKIEVCHAMTLRVFLPHEDMLDKLASGAEASITPLEDLEKACSDSLRLIASDKHRYRVAAILHQRCEYVKELTSIMRRRNICKDRMLERCARLFERAHELKHLATGWSPRMAAVGLQALITGLIVNGLERRKEFNFEKAGPACLHAFFKSINIRG
jgi:AcrR family transcriptional regulator